MDEPCLFYSRRRSYLNLIVLAVVSTVGLLASLFPLFDSWSLFFFFLRETANTDSITRSALSQDPPLQPPVLSRAGCPTLMICTTDCCGPITFASTIVTASGGDSVKRPHRSRRRTLENSYPMLLVNCSDQVGSPFICSLMTGDACSLDYTAFDC